MFIIWILSLYVCLYVSLCERTLISFYCYSLPPAKLKGVDFAFLVQCFDIIISIQKSERENYILVIIVDDKSCVLVNPKVE